MYKEGEEIKFLLNEQVKYGRIIKSYTAPEIGKKVIVILIHGENLTFADRELRLFEEEIQIVKWS